MFNIINLKAIIKESNWMKYFLTFALLFCCTAGSSLLAAPVKDMPLELTQPNGETVLAFVTGDEYHRRAHDKDGFTIIQNTATGYYVYARLENGQLVPTDLVFG